MRVERSKAHRGSSRKYWEDGQTKEQDHHMESKDLEKKAHLGKHPMVSRLNSYVRPGDVNFILYIVKA